MWQIQNMSRIRVWLLWASVLILSVGIASCAKPPQQDMEQARAAIEQAREMGAADYAPADLRAATDALAEAEAEINAQNAKLALFRKYGRAEELVAQARESAERAQANIEAGKERVRAEAQAALDAAHASIERGRDLIEGPEGKALKRAKETRQALGQISTELDAAEASLSSVDQALQEGKYTQALSLAKQGNQKALGLVSEVEMAIEKRRTVQGMGK